MSDPVKLKGEAVRYLTEHGFVIRDVQNDKTIMVHPKCGMLLYVHLYDSGELTMQLSDNSGFYFVSYFEKKTMSLADYESVPRRIQTVANHAALMLSMVEWSKVRADENYALRHSEFISLEHTDGTIVYRDDDLVLRLIFNYQDRRGTIIMQYFFILYISSGNTHTEFCDCNWSLGTWNNP